MRAWGGPVAGTEAAEGSATKKRGQSPIARQAEDEDDTVATNNRQRSRSRGKRSWSRGRALTGAKGRGAREGQDSEVFASFGTSTRKGKGKGKASKRKQVIQTVRRGRKVAQTSWWAGVQSIGKGRAGRVGAKGGVMKKIGKTQDKGGRSARRMASEPAKVERLVESTPEEMQKKVERSKRFGVALQEPEEVKKVDRAKRFGLAISDTTTLEQKKEERVKRFGGNAAGATTNADETKMAERAKRFQTGTSPQDSGEDLKKAERAKRFAGTAAAVEQKVKEEVKGDAA